MVRNVLIIHNCAYLPGHGADEKKGVGGLIMVGQQVEWFVGDIVHSFHGHPHGLHQVCHGLSIKTLPFSLLCVFLFVINRQNQ